MVALSSVLQTGLAWRRPTPGYFPDEYMYAELGRSLLAHGLPLVRGESGFLPLLYPLLTAPAWLWDSVELGYRSVQAFNAVAMSLAAVPAFLLARRLHVGDGLAVAVAALTVVFPELLYSSAVLAEPLAYPLALAAVAVAVAALERPLLRLQAAALGLGGLAAFTRLQLVVIPLCYVAAAVAVGLREGRLRATLRDHWLGSAGTVLALAALGVAGLTGRIGLYGDLGAYRVDLGVAAGALGVNALVLAYAAGWVVVPGALLGLALAIGRPRDRVEHAFGAFALVLILLMLVQASVVGDVGNVQERYAIYALPLVGCLFALYASRGWPHLRAHALLMGGLATAAAAVPLAGSAAGGGSAQSLVLVSLRQLERLIGDVGLASLMFAAGGAVLSAMVLGVALTRPRLASPTSFGLTAVVAVGITAGAFAYYQESRGAVRAAYLPADPSWVDKASREPVTLLLAPRSARADVHSTLFWNRSVERVVLLDRAERPDAFSATDANTDGAGRLELPPGLVLADGHGSTILLRSAEPVAAGPTKTLWRTGSPPQVELLLVGRYYSGLLAAEGGIRAWPAAPGGKISARLVLRLSVRGGGRAAVPIRFKLPDGGSMDRTITPGPAQAVRIPVCSTGIWTASYVSGSSGLVHGTRVGVHASAPSLVADPTACS